MKQNKFSAWSVTVVFVTQSLFFPGRIQAQTDLGVDELPPENIYNPLPIPQFGSNSTLMQDLNSCMVKSVLEQGRETTTSGTQIYGDYQSSKKSEVSSKTPTDQPPAGCKCEDINVELSPSCSSYGAMKKTNKTITGGTEEITERKASDTRIKKHFEDKKTIDAQISCLKNLDKCSGGDFNEAKKLMGTLDCQMNAMKKDAQNQAALLQQVLTTVDQQNGKMLEYEKNVQQQIDNIDLVLTGDPKLGGSGDARFKGLLGLNQEMKEQLNEIKRMKEESKSIVADLENAEKSNTQALDAARVGFAWKCLENNSSVGGQSLSCIVQDEKGKSRTVPCGVMQKLNTMIYKSAMTNNGKGIMNNATNRTKGNQLANMFNTKIYSRLKAMMGGVSAAPSDGQKEGGDGQAAESSGVPQVMSWQDIESKLGAEINEVSQATGLNVRQMLQAGTAQCFADADQFKNGQVRSSGSGYSREKLRIEKERRKIAAEIDIQLTKISSNFTDIVSVLTQGRQHSPLNMSQCPKNDPKKMLEPSCLDSVVSTVEKLQRGEKPGNGKNITSFKIKGGSLQRTVACTGLDGCINAMKDEKTKREQHRDTVIGARNKQTLQNNTDIQKSLTSYGQAVANVQANPANGMTAVYSQLKKTLMKMGISSPDSLKMMEPESLTPRTGQDGSMGPFEKPRDLMAVLSGAVPGGMIDFKDTGVKEILADINEKEKEAKSDRKEKINDLKEALKKYDSIKEECSVVNLDEKGSSENANAVQNMQTNCNSCQDEVNSCISALQGGNSNTDALDAQKAKLVESKKEAEELAKLPDEIKKLDDEIKKLKKKKRPTDAEKKTLDDRKAELNKKTERKAELEKHSLKPAAEYDAEIKAKQDEIDAEGKRFVRTSSSSSTEQIKNLEALLAAAGNLSAASKGRVSSQVTEMEDKLKLATANMGSDENCKEIQRTCNSCKDKAKRYDNSEKERIDQILKAK
jgi:hypothetical protein